MFGLGSERWIGAQGLKQQVEALIAAAHAPGAAVRYRAPQVLALRGSLWGFAQSLSCVAALLVMPKGLIPWGEGTSGHIPHPNLAAFMT